MNSCRIGTGLLVIALSGGCSESAVDRKAEARELMQLSKDWSAMLESGNLEASIDLWAEECEWSVEKCCRDLEYSAATRSAVRFGSESGLQRLAGYCRSCRTPRYGSCFSLLSGTRMKSLIMAVG